MASPPAASRYAGVRATITSSSDGRSAFLSLAVKSPERPWGDWTGLAPAIRLDMTDVTSTREALLQLSSAIAEVAEAL